MLSPIVDVAVGVGVDVGISTVGSCVGFTTGSPLTVGASVGTAVGASVFSGSVTTAVAVFAEGVFLVASPGSFVELYIFTPKIAKTITTKIQQAKVRSAGHIFSSLDEELRPSNFLTFSKKVPLPAAC